MLLAAVILFSSVSDAFAAVTQAQIDEVKRKRDQVSEEKMAQQMNLQNLTDIQLIKGNLGLHKGYRAVNICNINTFVRDNFLYTHIHLLFF